MEPAQLPEPVQQPFRMAVVSLFPEMVETALQYGITGRALETGLWRLWTVNPREFATDNHRTVDDRPYGGGPGMVMPAGPVDQSLDCALEFIRADGFEGRPMVVYLSPQGERLTHRRVLQLKDERALVLLAGRYEGIDERLLERRVDLEISIGDYVVSGGEFPALVLIDALVRQLPGATNDPDSVNEDSFVEGLLDCPHYTRPEVHAGATVPPVLLSGNHAQIRRWRLKQSLGRTWMRRPDLLSQRALNGEEARLLDEFVNEDRKRKNGEKQDGSG